MIRIGKIAATHGLQGALIVTHVVDGTGWLKKGDILFVEQQKQSYIPYFVTEAKPSKEGEYVVSVEEVETIEKAKKLVGKPAYVNEEILEQFAGESPLLWVGFKVVDKTLGELGVVDDVMHTTSQWLAKMLYKGAEVLIPLIAHTIENVNLKTRTLHLDLPEGLLEVYTSGNSKKEIPNSKG